MKPVRALRLTRMSFSIALSLAATSARAVPSFSRQTGFDCAACHSAFPTINAFGRTFKAQGYDLVTAQEVTAKGAAPTLAIPQGVPLSLMIIGSLSEMSTAVPGTKTGDVMLPDQLSLFYAGRIASGFGAFAQLTYDGQADHFSMDNLDVRYAYPLQLAGKPLQLGVTVNNNPTVQDLWNDTPAWGWPFVTSGVWPGEGTNAPLVAGGLAQAVVGAGVYGFWNDTVYAEVSLYRSAPLGVPRPLDATDKTTAANVIDRVAPYWRVALQHAWGNSSAEIGTYGLLGRLYPGAASTPAAPLSGSTDRYADVALDAQYQYASGDRSLDVHTSWIHEDRTLAASAAGATGTLQTWWLDAEAYWRWVGVGAGTFFTWSSNSPGVFGTANGRADTNGAMLEVMARPWENTSFRLQYTLYGAFDGRGTNYDGAGRSASDNDMLTFVAWLAF